jgi:protein gp37
MGRTTIAWCDFTFNIWWGCFKVSPGCTNCYAATFDRRVHGVDTDHWERTGSRRFMTDAYWMQPLKWNAAAKAAGVRYRVFCGSMCDWAEKHPNPEINRQMDAYRGRLFELIRMTPHLDWLLLTKRPENAAEYLPWMVASNDNREVMPWHNVWLGTTAENQEYADARIPLLLKSRAVVHFLSLEPLLGPINLVYHFADMACKASDAWVIAGAESGHHARPCEVEWLRSIRDQCTEAEVAFFLKQAVWEQPITVSIGSFTKGKGYGGDMVEMPYLDGKQHIAFPRAA